MSFEPPAGILDIGNATLRVGKLEVAETSGLNQGLQNIIKNDLLITENTTYAVNHKWGLKLPTTWVGEFEVKGHSGKYIDFNFYNENSASNAQGYNLTFKDTTMTLRYDGGNPLPITGDTVDSTLSLGDAGYGEATIPTIVGAFRKVNIFFERGVISVSIDGTRYLYFKESDGFNQGLGVASRVVSTTGSAFVNLFIEQNASDSKFKNLRIVNGRFISDKTSNIAFMGGNLGVGVNSPQEALDIRGNMHFNRVSNVSSVSVDSNVVAEYTGPHDRPLRKYPEVALTADAETASGYKGYKVTVSSLGGGDGTGFRAFDGNYADSSTVWGSGDFYNSSGGDATVSGAASTTVSGVSGAVIGEWISLQLPNKIRLQDVKIAPQSYSGTQYGAPRTPTKGVVAGSIDGTNWELVHSFTTGGSSHIIVNHLTSIGPINSTKYFNYFRIIAEEVVGGTNGTRFNLEELEYYGHEEGSGSLDTTLKTVYNVPATTGTQLEVYYDAKDLADGNAPTNPVDLSPNTTNATLGGNPQVSNGAFVFDGSGDAVISGATSFSGSPIHSYSMWFKTNSISSGSNSIVAIGHADTPKSIGIRIRGVGETNATKYRFYVWGGATNEGVDTDITAQIGIWTHATVVYDGLNMKLYIDGKFADENHNTTTNLALASGAKVALGNYIDSNGDVTGTASYDGSIANFRLYSKALNAGQIQELYDYQKDYFLGSKSQVTLYKGHLGVGVTEPSGQLELAGDERIQAYPPRGMTHPSGSAAADNNTAKNISYIEGHGEFKASASLRSRQDVDYDGHQPYNAFDYDGGNGNLNYTSGAFLIYGPGSGESVGYNKTTGYFEDNNYQLSASSGTPYGHWLQLEMPYKINVKSYFMTPHSDDYWPQDWQIWASNDDTNWTHIHTYIGGTYDANPQYYTVAHTGHYKIYTIIVTRIKEGSTLDRLRIKELRYFGTPGPTTLDKGSLTLGRSLDVPRISRYDVDTETPRPEKLVVDFDTTVNSSPTDISGNGNHGVLNDSSGKPTYSPADKAFDFDGVNGVIYVPLLSPAMTGDRICSMSAWFKTTNASSVNQTVMWLGAYAASGLFTVAVSNGALRVSIGDTCKMEVAGVIESNTWYHVVGIKAGTGAITSSNFSSIFKLYLNGEQLTGTFGGQTRTLNVTTNYWYIGAGNTTGAEHFDGYISNPKIYSVALEPSEVKKLYRLGRTGRSMVISDTAVGIGKVPEAQLDVRGIIKGQSPAVFIAQANAAMTATAAGAIALFGTVVTDTAGGWDSVNHRYYAKVPGFYLVNAAMFTIVTTNTYVVIRIDKNGVEYSATTGFAGPNGYPNTSLMALIYLSVGDYVRCRIGTDTNRTTASGHRLEIVHVGM